MMAAMLLRRLRWGLAGVLVAWTLIRLFGLERGWPLVPLLAFTPLVSRARAARRLAALILRRWWAALLAGRVRRGAARRGWRRGRSPTARRPARRACGCGCSPPTSPATTGRRARSWRRAALGRRRLQRRRAAAGGRARLRRRRHRRPAPRAARCGRGPGFTGTGLYARVPLRRHLGPAGTAFAFAAAGCDRRPAPRRSDSSPSMCRPRPGPGSRAAGARTCARCRPPGRPAAARAGRRLQRDARPRRAAATARPRLPRRRRAGRRALRPTWPADRSLIPALVTIDHVLADRRIRVVSARTRRDPRLGPPRRARRARAAARLSSLPSSSRMIGGSWSEAWSANSALMWTGSRSGRPSRSSAGLTRMWSRIWALPWKM